MARRIRRRVTRYRFTPARRAALKKAQLISARKRRRRKIAVGVAVGSAAVITGAVVRHKASGSSFTKRENPIISRATGKVTGTRRSFASSRLVESGRKPARTISYRTKRQGSSGTSYTYTYTHRPLAFKKVVLGKAIDKGAIPHYNPTLRTKVAWPNAESSRKDNQFSFVPPGGIKYRGGKKIPTANQWYQPKPASIPSRDIGRKAFAPQLPRSKATIRGQTIESYLKSIDKKYKVKGRRR